MLEDQINKEVERLSLTGQIDSPKKKKISGLVENYKEPLSKRVIDAVFSGDFKSVTNSLIYEVMIPKTKDLLADLFIGGIEKAIYGDGISQRSYTRATSRSSTKASYDAYYSGGKYYTAPEPAPKRAKVRWDRIVMKSRPEAVSLVNCLQEDIRKYKKVTITDLYDYVTVIDEELGAQIESEFPDNNWGWKNLDRIPIETVHGGYWVKLPKPESIN